MKRLLAIALLLASCGGTVGPNTSPVTSGDSAPPSSSLTTSSYHAPSIAVSTTAGDVIASADLVPEVDSVIEGMGPDGTRYRLEVPAFAVLKPITISLRPLSPVAIPGGRLVAGVELQPEGTTFTVPLTLTITPASGNVKALVPLQYTGTPSAATASLGAVKALDSSSVQMWLGHFSGGFVSEQSKQGSAEHWSKAGDLPKNATPADRIAWAQATMNALEYDDAFGVDPAPGLFRERMDNAWNEMVAAQGDVWKANHADLAQQAKDAKVQDAVTFNETLNQLLSAAIGADRVNEMMGSPNAATQATVRAILETIRTFLKNLITNLDRDLGFQKRLDDGLVSDYDSILEITDLLMARARQFALMGDDEVSNQLRAQVFEWMHRYAMKLAASCLQVPIGRDIATRIAHMAELLGDNELQAAMMKCVAAYDEANGPASPSPSASASPTPSATARGCQPDCRVDLTLGGPQYPMHYHGTKCGGPEGQWVIEGEGVWPSEAEGFSPQVVKSTMTFTIPAGGLSGPLSGSLTTRWIVTLYDNHGRVARIDHEGTDHIYSGTATFLPAGVVKTDYAQKGTFFDSSGVHKFGPSPDVHGFLIPETGSFC